MLANTKYCSKAICGNNKVICRTCTELEFDHSVLCFQSFYNFQFIFDFTFRIFSRFPAAPTFLFVFVVSLAYISFFFNFIFSFIGFNYVLTNIFCEMDFLPVANFWNGGPKPLATFCFLPLLKAEQLHPPRLWIQFNLDFPFLFSPNRGGNCSTVSITAAFKIWMHFNMAVSQ